MRSLWILALLCAVGGGGGSAVREPPAGGLELVILHNNDMHAHFEQTSQLSGVCTPEERDAGKCYGGFPRVAHVVKEFRAAAAAGGPPVLYLNAGDTYTGTAWFTLYKWRIAADFINALQPDAVSLGNHEFDESIAGLTPFLGNVSTPVLAANIIIDKEPELLNFSNLRKSVVIERNGAKIGIIGYLTPETKLTSSRNSVEYNDEIVSLQEEVNKLQAQGVKILIALGHSGYLKDLEIARSVVGIDLVIGGHSNTFLWNGTAPDSETPQGPYPTMVFQPSGKGIPVVQVYAFTKYLGKLHLVFDRNGEITKLDGTPILLDHNVPQDSDVLKLVELYGTRITHSLNEIIGNTSVHLDGFCRLSECNMGNLITDSIVEYYADRYEGKLRTDSPIALLHSGRIRTSIKGTVVRRGDLVTVLPFTSSLMAVTINGTILRKALEHSVSVWRPVSPTGEFLQVSGLKVVYDLARPPGERLVRVEARCGECNESNYVGIDNNKTYKVILPSFLFDGGIGFVMFKGLPSVVLPYDEVTCVTEYLKKHSPIEPKVTNRITLLNESTVMQMYYSRTNLTMYNQIP